MCVCGGGVSFSYFWYKANGVDEEQSCRSKYEDTQSDQSLPFLNKVAI